VAEHLIRQVYSYHSIAFCLSGLGGFGAWHAIFGLKTQKIKTSNGKGN
jgi:hypothetical protein